MAKSKQKGQMSFDLLFTLIAAIAFLTLLSSFANSFLTQGTDITLNTELKTILLETHSAIGNAKAFGLIHEFTSETINSEKPVECTIKVTTTGISVESKTQGKSVSYNSLDLTGIKIENESDEGIFPIGTNEFRCGEKVTIKGL